MTAAVIPYVHPSIRAYQRAYEAYFDAPAPRVSRRTNKGFVIHGSTGDSRLITEKNLLTFATALRRWTEDRIRA